MNIADALDRNRCFFADRDAVVFGGRTWSYGELWADANRVASALAGLGVTAGDKVCVFLSNRPEFVTAYYGCQKLGAVCVSLSSLSKADEIEYMANDSESVALITEVELLAEVPARPRIAGVRTVVTVGGGGGDVTWEALLAGGAPEFTTARTDREDGAAIIYTSGTTGRPKGVVLTHGNVVSNTNATKYMTGMRGEDRAVCFLPIYHSFGQNFIVNAVVQAGCTLVLHKKFELEPVLASLRENRVTRWYAVPPIYILMLNHPDRRAVDEALGAVRYCFSAAASMPGEVARRWKERFALEVNEGYGLTETTPFASYNHEFRHKEGSVGTAIMNVEIAITDPDGSAVPRGELGEIWIKGPNVMKGYYRKPEATLETIVDGYVRSGDIGYMDEEGYIFIVDRLKDMINASGLKIWPREVEEVLYTHPNVKECAVIGVPHEVFGETVKAVIALREPGTTTAEELVDLCRRHLADYKAPRLVEFVPELPKNATGKILKREVRDEAPPRS
ncbi:MAG: long-chain fatty acid--CoA ligase [Deltaproteobacteria bacterium]|nr:long-chain fatty acid--CoA ligase [Deltaproteobacteria bacterium]